MIKRYLLPFCLLLTVFGVNSQGKIDDYQRAFSLRDNLKNKVLYDDVNAQWIGNTQRFWYVRNTPQGKVYVVTDAKQLKRKVLFDHTKLAAALQKAVNHSVDANGLSLTSLQVSETLDTLTFLFNNTDYQYVQHSNQLVSKGKHVEPKERYWGEIDEEKEAPPAVSPYG